jgi:TolB-like protein/DNA-binding winged helix-turn-helix (wHTH) protein
MTGRYRFDDIEVDPQGFRLLKAGRPIAIEPKALRLLVFLIENRGRLVSRRELLDAIWGDAFVTDHVLNRAIGQLRRQLADDAKEPRYVETVPTLGYRFIANVEADTVGVEAAPSRKDEAFSLPAPRGLGEQPNALLAEGAQLRPPASILLTDESRVDETLPTPQILPTETPAPTGTGRRMAVAVGIALLLMVSVIAFWIARRRPRPAGGRPIQSLAVLPLKNLSGDASQQYLADGMTDELITSLGQIGSLRVISLTTAMQYKDAHKSLQQIAGELNADAIVEGSVLRSGDRIRIAAHLVDASLEKQLWAHNYEGDMRDTLGLQNQVASAVAEQIRVKLTAKEQTELKDAKNVDPRAYDALLKGNYFFRQNSPATLEKSLQYFQQAVALDPKLARAYVGIARCYNFLAQGPVLGHGIVSAGEATAASDSAVAQALLLQPDLSEAYAERAWTLLFYHWDFPGTERDFRHALELNPGSADAHEGYGTYQVVMGRFDDGLAQMKEAGNLDPLSPFFLKDDCTLLSYARRYDEAVTQCLAALELDPNLKWGLSHLADTYLQKREYVKAHEFLARLGDCDRACMAMEDEVHGAPGRRGAFDSWLKTQKTPNAFFLAQAYAGLGRKDEAFAALEKAYEEHSNPHGMTYTSVDAHFDSLRSDPRFDLFLRHSGLPPQPHDLLALHGQSPGN